MLTVDKPDFIGSRGRRRKNLGTSRDNPFTPKDFGDTLQGFNQHVPLGAWFVDEAGKLRQRTKAPPGMGSNDTIQDYMADQMALAPT